MEAKQRREKKYISQCYICKSSAQYLSTHSKDGVVKPPRLVRYGLTARLNPWDGHEDDNRIGLERVKERIKVQKASTHSKDGVVKPP